MYSRTSILLYKVRKKIKPFLKSGVLYLAVRMTTKVSGSVKKRKRFVHSLIEIPSDKLPRFVTIPSKENETNILFLDDIIRNGLNEIYSGFDIKEVRSVKLSRDAELYIEDEFSGNLLLKIKKSLNKRSIGAFSRFLYDIDISKDFLKFLKDALSIAQEDLSAGGRYHNYSDLIAFPVTLRDKPASWRGGHQNLKDLEYENLIPVENRELKSKGNTSDFFFNKDALFYFPYEDFSQIVKLFDAAASDSKVNEIKVTLYRVAKNSMIIKSLLEALKKGKSVTVFIEIKARFDEEANLEYAAQLENAGAKVLYSIPGLKVHAKIALITREENGEIRNYGYLSTGNFNEKTAKIYSDFGLFTSDNNITSEASLLFDYLEGKIKAPEFHNILVSQFNMKNNFIRLIDEEINNVKNGFKGEIILKLNNLEDKKMIEKLYEANKAGVKIEIIVRAVCCLIPGVKELSQSIRAVSIVDRFLEHSRVFIFHNKGEEKIFLSSADWMKRNLVQRIEVAFPISNNLLKKKIKDILMFQLTDNVKSRIIDKEQKNNFYRNNYSEAIRSQTRTYEYLKQ